MDVRIFEKRTAFIEYGYLDRIFRKLIGKAPKKVSFLLGGKNMGIRSPTAAKGLFFLYEKKERRNKT